MSRIFLIFVVLVLLSGCIDSIGGSGGGCVQTAPCYSPPPKTGVGASAVQLTNGSIIITYSGGKNDDLVDTIAVRFNGTLLYYDDHLPSHLSPDIKGADKPQPGSSAWVYGTPGMDNVAVLAVLKDDTQQVILDTWV